MTKINPTILYVFKLPPPINGATKSNLQIKESEKLRNNFRSFYINYGLSRGSDDFGTIRIQKFWFYIRSLIKLFFYLSSRKIDIVYITISPKGFSFFKDSVFVLISKLFLRKTLIHLHGKGIGKRASESTILNIYYKFVFRNTSVICLSDLLKKDIQSIYNGQPYIVPNGIPEINYKKSVIEVNSKPKVLFLSNLYVKKGIINFIEIIKEMKSIAFDFEALIVGNSTKDFSINDLKSIIDSNELDDFIKVLGPVYGQEKNSVFESVDIFLFPTEWPNEAFPIVLLEALQFGLPVIASPEGGIPDIIEEGINGFIVNSKDYKKYADKTIAILKDTTKYRNISKLNREKYNSLYTLQNFEDNLNKVFYDLYSS